MESSEYLWPMSSYTIVLILKDVNNHFGVGGPALEVQRVVLWFRSGKKVGDVTACEKHEQASYRLRSQFQPAEWPIWPSVPEPVQIDYLWGWPLSIGIDAVYSFKPNFSWQRDCLKLTRPCHKRHTPQFFLDFSVQTGRLLESEKPRNDKLRLDGLQIWRMALLQIVGTVFKNITA